MNFPASLPASLPESLRRIKELALANFLIVIIIRTFEKDYIKYWHLFIVYSSFFDIVYTLYFYILIYFE